MCRLRTEGWNFVPDEIVFTSSMRFTRWVAYGHAKTLLAFLSNRGVLIKSFRKAIKKALLYEQGFFNGVPKGIRTPVTAVKGRCPRPLDDGDVWVPSLSPVVWLALSAQFEPLALEAC